MVGDHSSLPTPTGPRRGFWWYVELIQVRLRFIFLMVVIGLIVGYWETITNYVDRWRRPAAAEATVAANEIEFYCPMHPNIVRVAPGSCPICGMPLSRRARSEQAELPEGVLARQTLTPQKVQIGRIGTTPVGYQLLSREMRTVGIIDYDETRRKFIAARIKGRIDKLFVNYVGQFVEKGDPLVGIYSPELLTAQQELLTAGSRMNASTSGDGFSATVNQSLLEASKQKLLLWGITPEQIDQILSRGTVETHLTVFSPISGFVTEKSVLEGHYVEEGGDLYTVADLSVVWMQAKIFEEDSGNVQVGTAVEVVSTAYPEDTFAGRITFIAYQVDPATRTVAARVEVDNPDFKLKPGMYAHALIRVPVGRIEEVDPPSASRIAIPPTPGGISTNALAAAYLTVSQAMVDDKTDEAALTTLINEAERLAGRPETSLATKAAAVAKEARLMSGRDLSAQRGLFGPLSARAVELFRSHPPTGRNLYVAHCPMVEADWLQDSPEVANPYMGSQMLKCGEVTGTIQPRAAGESDAYAEGYYCPISPDHLFAKPEMCPIDKFPLKFVRAEKTLAVPVSAVVNTGTRTVVYRESEPDTFDMVEVKLGKRAGEYYPVLDGVKAGDKLATAGAFLVDAENRLNPAAGAQYFGAGSPDAKPH